MPSVLLKSDEQARPTPLSVLAVKLSDEEFVFRMPDFAELNDRVRNMRLVRERSWFAVPLI